MTLFKYLFAALFILGGLNHFVNSALYVSIMPAYLPWHLALVYASGVAEVVLGALLLVPGAQRFAAWGLILLLIAVFPANLNMALNSQQFPAIPAVLLWIRLPLQLVLIAAAYVLAQR